MKSVTFKSNSEKKINLLIEVAKEMGIKSEKPRELTDEDMAVPGYKPTVDEFEAWLAKDDGEEYGIDESFDRIRKELSKQRKAKLQKN